MTQQTKYKEEIIKELQDIQEKDPLLDLKNIAIETGIKDLAEHHGHYLYGVSGL